MCFKCVCGGFCVLFNNFYYRNLPHRKLLDGQTCGGKLTPLAISPDDENTTDLTTELTNNQRRTSITTLVSFMLGFFFVFL